MWTVSNKGNETCPICSDSFGSTDEDKAWTHVGGQNHDGIHKKCWRTWLQVKNACPMCTGQINLSSLFSFKERIAQYARLLQVSSLVIAATAVGATAGGLVTNSITGGPLIPTAITTCIIIGNFLIPNLIERERHQSIALGLLGGAGTGIGAALGTAAGAVSGAALAVDTGPIGELLRQHTVVEQLVRGCLNAQSEYALGLSGGLLGMLGILGATSIAQRVMRHLNRP